MVNLYKSNEGFSASTFTGLIKNGVENIPNEIKDDLIQVEDFVYQDLLEHKLMWSNGVLVNNPNYNDYVKEQERETALIEKQNRIRELKQLLSESDYRAIKYFEGYYTDDEYAPYKEQRQAYRDEINLLESEL